MKATTYALYFDVSFTLLMLFFAIADHLPLPILAVLGLVAVIAIFVILNIYLNARNQGIIRYRLPHYPGRIVMMLVMTGILLFYMHNHFPQASALNLAIIGSGCVLFAMWSEIHYWQHQHA